MQGYRVRTAALAAAALAGAGSLAAQGSSVYVQGACASARGAAAVAAPCVDGSSVFYNPAALVTQPSVVSAGLTAIMNSGSFTYDRTGVEVERETAAPLVPHGYASYRFGGRWAAAVGVFAPYGLGIEWPEEEFEGRFISWKTRLQGLYLQPTVAYRLIPGRLSIGAGVDVVFGGIEINRRLDAPVEDAQLAALGVPLGTDFAAVKLAGSGTGVGGHVALLWEPTDRLAFGARYMTAVEVDLEGDADFEPIQTGLLLYIPDPTPLDALLAPQFAAGGPLSDQDASADMTLPAQAVLGVRFGATDALSVTGDYQWTRWSSFDRIVAVFDIAPELALNLNYEDTHTFRTGFDYVVSPALDLRGGFIYNTAASPDESVTPILPEADRQLYTAGLGYRLGPVQIDGYYNYVRQADRRGRVRTELLQPGSAEDLNIGVYSSAAHLFGLTLAYVFGTGE